MNLQQILQQEGDSFENLPSTDLTTKDFLYASHLRVAKSVLQRVREEIGEDEKEKHEFDCHAYELEERQYECSCGNDCVVKGCNQEKARQRLAYDTIERELEGELFGITI